MLFTVQKEAAATAEAHRSLRELHVVIERYKAC